MRTLIVTVIVSLSCLSSVLADGGGRYVIPIQESVGVYGQALRPLFSQALFVVGPDDRLAVIGQQGGCYEVKARDGRSGWVEKRLVVAARRSAEIRFGESVVSGYLDNPEMMVILDVDDPLARPLVLERSFGESLRQNIDRETATRTRM